MNFIKRFAFVFAVLASNVLFAEGGRLTIYRGPMFAGKSTKLLEDIEQARSKGIEVLAINHAWDVRFGNGEIVSHDKKRGTAIMLGNDEVEKIKELASNSAMVFIDEVQFFPDSIIHVINFLLDMGKEVVVSGLDYDFRKVPFGVMPQLYELTNPDYIHTFVARCTSPGCDEQAPYTQRLVDGYPAKYDDPVVVIGAEEMYIPRCPYHHEVLPAITVDSVE